MIHQEVFMHFLNDYAKGINRLCPLVQVEKLRLVLCISSGLSIVLKQLRMPPMPERALPPVLALLSDGQPTDDFDGGLKELLDLPWGKKAVRMAIAIGQDCDREILQKFIANPELRPLEANSPEALVSQIKWVSTVVVQAASAPPSPTLGLPGPVRRMNSWRMCGNYA